MLPIVLASALLLAPPHALSSSVIPVADTVRIAPGGSTLDARRVPRGSWVYELSGTRGDGTLGASSGVNISIRDTVLPGGAALVIRRSSETSRGPVSTISLVQVAGMRPIRESYEGPDGRLDASWSGPPASSVERPDSLAFSDLQLITLLGSASTAEANFVTVRAMLSPGRSTRANATVTSKVETGKRVMTLRAGELEYLLTYGPDGLLQSQTMKMFDGGTLTLQLVGR